MSVYYTLIANDGSFTASPKTVNNAKALRNRSYFFRENVESQSGKTEFNIRKRVDVGIGQRGS